MKEGVGRRKRADAFAGRVGGHVCFLALMARSHTSLGHRPRILTGRQTNAESAIQHTVRCQSQTDWRWNGIALSALVVWRCSIPGASPRAGYECRAAGAKQIQRSETAAMEAMWQPKIPREMSGRRSAASLPFSSRRLQLCASYGAAGFFSRSGRYAS